jgi:hypothetical protein
LVNVPFKANRLTAGELSIERATGHRLPCGVFARWSAE